MNSQSAHCTAAGRKPATPYLRHLCAGIAVALLAASLSACSDSPADKRPAFVRTAIVRPQERQTSVTLTGSSSGCSTPEYEFWAFGPGGSWTVPTFGGFSGLASAVITPLSFAVCTSV